MRVRAQRHPSPASRTAAAMARQLSSLPTRDDTNEELLISSATGSEPPLLAIAGISTGYFGLPGWLIICTLPLAIAAIIACVWVSRSAAETPARNPAMIDREKSTSVRNSRSRLQYFNIRLNTAQDPPRPSGPDAHINEVPVVRSIRHVRRGR